MPGDEDNLGFTALDDNIVGDGKVDADTKPLDTMLESVNDARSKAMRHRGSRCKKSYFAGTGSERSPRRFTARNDRMAIAVIPWHTRPGLQEIHASLAAEVGCEGSNTSGKMKMWLQLRPADNQEGAITNTTISETGGRTAYPITLDTSDLSLSPGVGALILWVQSRAQEETGSEDIDSFNVHTYSVDLDQNGAIYPNIDATTYFGLGRPYKKESGTVFYSYVDEGSLFYKPGVGVGPDSNDNPVYTFTVEELSWVAPTGLSIDARYNKNETAGGFVAKTPAAVEPQRQVTGTDVAEHPETLDGIVRRPKCRAIGPHGQEQGEDWPTDYHRQWSWISTDGEADIELDRQSFQLRYDSSTIRCVCYVKPFFSVTTIDGGAVWGFDYDEIDLSTYQDHLVTGDLELTVSVSQAQISDTWSNQPSTEATQTVEDIVLHRARPQGELDLPNNVLRAHYQTDTAAEYEYTFKEGMLGRDDFSLFTVTGTTKIEVDPDGMQGLDRSQPVRCDLRTTGFSTGPDTSDIATPNDDDIFEFHVLCLGTSWWEEPQV